MIVKYLIKECSTNQYYTDYHFHDPNDRWTTDISNAYQFDTYADAQTEIETDIEITGIFFTILEVYIPI